MLDKMTQLYLIEWDGGADYACQACANKFVLDNGLEWDNSHSLNYVLENDKGLSVWVDFYGQIESDSPQACECGQWLKVSLTRDGEDYLKEIAEDLPSYVLKYYGMEKEKN